MIIPGFGGGTRKMSQSSESEVYRGNKSTDEIERSLAL